MIFQVCVQLHNLYTLVMTRSTIPVRARQQNKIIQDSELEAADDDECQYNNELEAQDDGEEG